MKNAFKIFEVVTEQDEDGNDYTYLVESKHDCFCQSKTDEKGRVIGDFITDENDKRVSKDFANEIEALEAIGDHKREASDPEKQYLRSAKGMEPLKPLSGSFVILNVKTF